MLFRLRIVVRVEVTVAVVVTVTVYSTAIITEHVLRYFNFDFPA